MSRAPVLALGVFAIGVLGALYFAEVPSHSPSVVVGLIDRHDRYAVPPVDQAAPRVEGAGAAEVPVLPKPAALAELDDWFETLPRTSGGDSSARLERSEGWARRVGVRPTSLECRESVCRVELLHDGNCGSERPVTTGGGPKRGLFRFCEGNRWKTVAYINNRRDRAGNGRVQ